MCCFRWCGRPLCLRDMPISGVNPTPRTTAVYASNPALPRRPQDSLPSRLLSLGRTRLALASSYQLLLSHPASGSHLGCLTANRSDGHGCRILGLGSQSSAIFPACCHVVLSLWLRRLSVRHQISLTRCRNVTSAGRFVGTA